MQTVAGFEFPDERYYETSQHLWVRPDTVGRIIVGIDRLGLEALGELAYVSLHAIGSRLARGDAFGTLEAAKMTTDVSAPVSGLIVERNESVVRDPLLVGRDPYDQGWLVVIEPTSWDSESAEFVSGPAIAHWAAAEVERYRTEGFID